MPLPVLPSATDIRTITERVNVLTRYYNRTPVAALTSADTFPPIYALDTGSATAYAIAPVPGVEQYVVGQIFAFKAANANTGTAPTLNVNSLGAGTITYPGGGALVPGDIAANGFYFVEVTATTPTFQLLTSAGGRSKLLQTVSTQTGAVATGTTTIPFDDTIPQNTEGDQYMSLAITPKLSTSTLIIDVVGVLSTSAVGTNGLTLALFQDTTANALAAQIGPSVAATVMLPISFRHIMTSGTTSATTFKVRGGCNAAGTTTFNGSAGGRIYGGVLASSVVIREVLP